MKTTTIENTAEQVRRITSKTQDQRMINEVVAGTGMSPWEAKVLVQIVSEIYFTDPARAPLRHGQLYYTCVKIEAGAGVPLEKCPLTSVTLTLLGTDDPKSTDATRLRQHRVGRLCEEAREQGGLLTQEDLAQLLGCDVRTIRRDIAALKALGIHVPTRGQQKDIGPTLTHKGVAIRHWIEGKEPQEVARAINHSLTAVERYLNHFARIIYCVSKGMNLIETAFAIGISSPSINAYLEIYNNYKDKAGCKERLGELNAIGEAHYESGDAKKGAPWAADALLKSSQKGAKQP
jgi:hypothetical protein